MTEQEFIKEFERLNHIAEEAAKVSSEFLQQGVQYAPLKVGDRIRYKYGTSTEAEVSKVYVWNPTNELYFKYFARPVLKSGELGKQFDLYTWNIRDVTTLIIR